MGALVDRNDDDHNRDDDDNRHHVVVNEAWEFDNHVSLGSCQLSWISFDPLLENAGVAPCDAPTELMGAS